ncbi:MAG TPA: hypothetical protein DCK98_05235 [Chloroflexi bacterium]|jgi:hypothetical protein|nr:hypothetical protein [Chloroflexota bacterium]HAL25273.1 hypothetical protein [Chloroflexota bacterium]
MTERKRAAAINADSGEQHDVRLDYAAAAPDATEAMRGLEKVVGRARSSRSCLSSSSFALPRSMAVPPA